SLRNSNHGQFGGRLRQRVRSRLDALQAATCCELIFIKLIMGFDSISDHAIARGSRDTKQNVSRFRLPLVNGGGSRLPHRAGDQFRSASDTTTVVTTNWQLNPSLESRLVDWLVGPDVNHHSAVSQRYLISVTSRHFYLSPVAIFAINAPHHP
ncbi:MAG TPA: hypothetical protein VIU12_26260, partial [Chryseolinea sp.]